MNVKEYERKFTELSRMAPFIADDETNKCHKFVQGLNKKIKAYVVAVEHREFGQLVEAVSRVERTVQEDREPGQKQKLG